MSFIRLAGTVVSVADTYGTAYNVTALTNATEAVATVQAGHGLVVGDIIELTSGWPRADKKVLRVKTVATNDVTLEGFNTTNTTNYPAGTGTGSLRKITAWQQLGQISQDISADGGQQQFTNIRLLDRFEELPIPTTISGVTYRLPLYFDPAQAWVPKVQAYRDGATVVAVRFVYPGGSRALGSGYLGMLDTPTPRDGLLGGELTVSYVSQPQLYAS